MNQSGMRAIGGQMLWETLTSRLDEKTYDVIKANSWLLLLKDKKVPTKWLKPAKAGTKVNFNIPQKQEEWDESYEGLKIFIHEINIKHGLDVYLSNE